MSSDPPEPNSQGVRFSKQYTVASTTDSTACILDSVQWADLTAKVEALKLPNSLLENFGTALLGTALACLISFFASVQKVPSVPEWVYLWFFCGTLAVGLWLFLVGFSERKNIEGDIKTTKDFVTHLKKIVHVTK